MEFFDAIYDHLYEFIGAYMFLALALTLFTGLPVAIALGGISVIFGGVAIYLEFLDVAVFFQVIQRVWGGDGASGAVQNPILVAVPCFVFMGTMLEKSRVAEDLLHILQVMLRRVPGALALSVTVMGTIMAATTGIIGASVVMMTLLALPAMLHRGYHPALATGTIAASATLGILIPPSIMLVLMANLLAVSVGNLFIGAIFPGLVLSGLYFAYILLISGIRPQLAPPLPDDAIVLDPTQKKNVARVCFIVAGIVLIAYLGTTFIGDETINWGLSGFLAIFAACMLLGRVEGDTMLGGVLRGFVPPIFLIVMVLGSIFAGWATPTEAAGVGAFGSLILAWFNRTLTRQVLTQVIHRTALTTAMIFFIFVGATAFSTIFRNVYGEDLIIEFIEWLDLHPWSLLFMLMFTIFLLGFFFDFLEITLIILPVFAPVIRALAPAFANHLGYAEPSNVAETQFLEAQVIYWFAILVATNLQTSFLTPPFGFALFYMKGVAPSSVKMQDIYFGIIPFVALQVVGILLVLEFPGLALWLPEQILGR
ncbi:MULTISPECIES: TRAP transporter large permease [Thalassobaculum]|uniref:TRAP transporter, DctM subunit n=1 Tax=Thalassobaculum litoreum DSM 18839 TaxID=1123362 RepID=A0A8G2EV08_9PROT|nr:MULTISPECIES: TRAP transporter large permease subunit [Thalassobaculum]SDF09294.1 TRAP transporter, DctM subunit [Thalassobaculum litoreum DSM 18839]